MALQILREVKLRLVEHPENPVTVICNAEVGDYLRSKKQESFDRITERFSQPVELQDSKEFRQDVFTLA